jgi:hypothetical protein
MTEVDAVLLAAVEQVARENFDAAVAAKVTELRTRKSLWQRLLDKLPFTITIRRKKQ